MNAIVPHQPPPPPSLIDAFIPQTLDDAIRLAKAMSSAGMAPEHLKGDTGTCLMIVEQALRWRMSPFSVAQCTSNVKGKLMWEGKLVAAAIASCGAIVGEFDYEFTGNPKKPDTLSVVVSAKRSSDQAVKTLTLSWTDAKTDNGFWLKQPEQQLAYAGARVWARRWTPGPLLGVYAREEFNRSGDPAPTFDGTTIEATAEPEAPEQTDRRDEINAEVPVRPAAAAASTPRAPRRAEPAAPATNGNLATRTDEQWNAWLAKLRLGVMAVHRSSEVDEIARRTTVTDVTADPATPPWVTREIDAVLAEGHAKFVGVTEDAADPDAAGEPELPPVEIAGERYVGAGD